MTLLEERRLDPSPEFPKAPIDPDALELDLRTTRSPAVPSIDVWQYVAARSASGRTGAGYVPKGLPLPLSRAHLVMIADVSISYRDALLDRGPTVLRWTSG